jgi:hypothetical protein
MSSNVGKARQESLVTVASLVPANRSAWSRSAVAFGIGALLGGAALAALIYLHAAFDVLLAYSSFLTSAFAAVAAGLVHVQTRQAHLEKQLLATARRANQNEEDAVALRVLQSMAQSGLYQGLPHYLRVMGRTAPVAAPSTMSEAQPVVLAVRVLTLTNDDIADDDVPLSLAARVAASATAAIVVQQMFIVSGDDPGNHDMGELGSDVWPVVHRLLRERLDLIDARHGSWELEISIDPALVTAAWALVGVTPVGLREAIAAAGLIELSRSVMRRLRRIGGGDGGDDRETDSHVRLHPSIYSLTERVIADPSIVLASIRETADGVDIYISRQ